MPAFGSGELMKSFFTDLGMVKKGSKEANYSTQDYSKITRSRSRQHSEECMCCLQNIAMHDYQESVTNRQTDAGQTDRQTPDKLIPMCRYVSQVTQKMMTKTRCHETFYFQGWEVGKLLTYSLLIWQMVLPFVHLDIIDIEERQPAQRTLFGGGPRLVFQQVSVVRLGLAPSLGYKLHTECLQAVQA